MLKKASFFINKLLEEIFGSFLSDIAYQTQSFFFCHRVGFSIIFHSPAALGYPEKAKTLVFSQYVAINAVRDLDMPALSCKVVNFTVVVEMAAA